MTHDRDAAEEFYSRLFGWRFRSTVEELRPVVVATLYNEPVATLVQAPQSSLPALWTTYLAVESADDVADAIRGNGGTVAVGPLQAGPAGRLAVAADPFGAVFGIWQAGNRAGSVDVPAFGTPAWSELVTSDALAAAMFYSAVFGVKIVPVGGPEDDALEVLVDGKPVGGIVGRSEDAARYGAHWLTYFDSADVEQTTHQAVELGGAARGEPFDSSWGRAAALRDHAGSPFHVIERTRAGKQQMPRAASAT